MKIAVTGGATGIGRELVGLYKKQGASVTVFDILEPDYAVDQYIAMNLASPESIERAVAQAEGPFDALCNVAGLPPREGNGPLGLRVNFLGTRQFTQAMLNKLSDGAAIVNVASKAGAMWRQNSDQVKQLMALPAEADSEAFCEQNKIDDTRAYNLSKEAVIVWTMAECEALLAKGIRMNTVSPAAVETGILKEFKAAFGEATQRNINRVGRAGSPEEIAEVVLFLASAQSNWLKGIDICVDGGMGACNITDALELNSCVA
ncbi:MAG: coniferyl-alcohol dehydrogenase [Amphritea sp.]